MNDSKIEIKIHDLINTLLDRKDELIARRAEITNKLKAMNAVNCQLSKEYGLIARSVGDDWEDMLNDLSDEICDIEDAINDLEQDFNDYDDMISDIDYAFDAALEELEAGVFSTKLY